jgi:hypothetical protein
MALQSNADLKTWERKILRYTAQCKHQKDCRIRTNDKLQVMYRKWNIVTTINARRLELAGHVITMSNDRTVKIPDGRRKTGRPKLRWLDYWGWSERVGCQEMEE